MTTDTTEAPDKKAKRARLDDENENVKSKEKDNKS